MRKHASLLLHFVFFLSSIRSARISCAHKRGIIFRNIATLGNWLTVRCGAKEQPDRDCSRTRRQIAYCSAAEFSSRYRDYGHRRHGHGLHGRCRRLQLPHCKHPRCDRADLCFLWGLVVLRPGKRRSAMRAIFFEIGEHEIMPRQEPIAFAEFRRRRILGRQLAFSRPSTITLRRRYVVISHSLARGH
jgi:hypothetical protein